MAALYQRKGGGIWYVDFFYHGKRYRKSTKTSDGKLAELFQKDIEVKIARDNLGFAELNRKEVSLSEFIEEYLKYSKAEKSKGTYLLDKRALEEFRDFIGNIHLSKVTHKQGEDYKLFRIEKVKPVSVNIFLRQIKAAFETAVRWEYLKENPLKKVKQYKVKNDDLPKFLTKSEVNALLEKIPAGHFRLFILFCLYTGCRRGEALNLKWEDVDMESGMLKFRLTKTGKSRVIPLNNVLMNAFRNLSRNGDRVFPFHANFVTHKFKKYLRVSGIPSHESLHLHSLRHTFASHMIMAGVDLMTVSKLLGHSTIRTTELYAHLVPDHVKASIARLTY
jgi:integrase